MAKPPSDKDPNGGDYWRQAVFYKILVDNHDEVVVFSNKAIHYKKSEYIPIFDSPFYRKAGRRKRSDFLIPADFLFLDKNVCFILI